VSSRVKGVRIVRIYKELSAGRAYFIGIIITFLGGLSVGIADGDLIIGLRRVLLYYGDPVSASLSDAVLYNIGGGEILGGGIYDLIIRDRYAVYLDIAILILCVFLVTVILQ